MLFGSQALAAYDQKREYSDGDNAGNSNFRAWYGWNGRTENWKEPSTNYTSADRKSTGWQQFYIDTKVFGKQFRVLYAEAFGGAYYRGTSNYFAYETGEVSLAGQKLFVTGTYNHTQCPGKAAAHGCISYSNSLSKTLFSASGSFTLAGFVPITVSTSVTGNVYGGLEASTYTQKYLGINRGFHGIGTSKLNAGAYVSSRNSVSAGIPYVVQVGVGVNFKLIDVGLVPTMQSYQTTYPTSTGLITGPLCYANKDTVNLSTMSGNVEIWGKIADGYIWSDKLTLLSWSGYNYNADWVNDSACQTL